MATEYDNIERDPLATYGAEIVQVRAQIAAATAAGLTAVAATLTAELAARVADLIADRDEAEAATDTIVVRRSNGLVYELPLSALASTLESMVLLVETMESASIGAGGDYLHVGSNGDIYVIAGGATTYGVRRVNVDTLRVTSSLIQSASWGGSDTQAVFEDGGYLYQLSAGATVDRVALDLSGPLRTAMTVTGGTPVQFTDSRAGAALLTAGGPLLAARAGFGNRYRVSTVTLAGVVQHLVDLAQPIVAGGAHNGFAYFMTTGGGGWQVYQVTAAGVASLVGSSVASVPAQWTGTTVDACRGLLAVGNRLFFREAANNSKLYTIDTSTGVCAEITFPGSATPPSHPVYHARTGKVYVAKNAVIYAVNASTAVVERAVTVPASIYAIGTPAIASLAVDATWLYALDTANSSVRRLIP